MKGGETQFCHELTITNQSPNISKMMVAAEPIRFLAPDHTGWTVHEVSDPYSARGFCLIFVSEHGFRRVREYPPEWRELAPADLWALSWSR